MTSHSGQCLCGDIKYDMKADLSKTGACHCDMCRRQNSGSAFHGVMCDSIEWTGSSEPKWYKSSDLASRGFCQSCGTVIAWRLESMASQPAISIGTLNDVSGVSLRRHIFTDQASHYAPPPKNAPHQTKAEILAEWNA